MILPILLILAISLQASANVVIDGPPRPAHGRDNIEEYLKNRQKLVERSYEHSFEHNVTLNDREKMANDVIMRFKRDEIKAGFLHPGNFTPARHFFHVLSEISESKLFHLIREMPKGAILHIHDTAMSSADYMVSVTYDEHLWQCSTNGIIATFRFSRAQPTHTMDQKCQWFKVSEMRKNIGPKMYDQYVRTLFTLYTDDPVNEYQDINTVWNKFQHIFEMTRSIITYAPAWGNYFKQALREMSADGVQYLEFRSILPDLYDLDGTNYTLKDIVQIYNDALHDFKQENLNFIGAKLIYAPHRLVSNETIKKYMDNVVQLHNLYPNFTAGFDFVGQEDLGRRLIDFAPFVLQLPADIKGFFHAGETNWFGETDENLFDAVLLGAERIGHGYGLVKYPTLIDLVKKRNIAVEVNPISNQVLKLVFDYRNHPASIYFAQNVPLVISSDDCAMWEATPLSHDFYLAFMGIASAHSDLRTLKKLAHNSLEYSSLNATEKDKAFKLWRSQWDQYIEHIIHKYTK